MGDQHHKYTTKDMLFLFFSRRQQSKTLLGQDAANLHDMKFLLKSRTLLGILLKFSAQKPQEAY